MLVNRLPLIIFFIYVSLMVKGQHTFYFIGDAGEDTVPRQALLKLGETIKNDPNSTVIFLGDNIYPQGLELKKATKRYKKSEKHLLSQLNILRNYPGLVYFIPGNHDWRAGKKKGLQAVKAEQDYIEHFIDQTTVRNRFSDNFLPKNGLPGPDMTEITEIQMIFIDLDWWLHRQIFHPVGMVNGQSREDTEMIFFSRLDSLLNQAKIKQQKTIILAHHPLFSNGYHGAKKPILRFLNNYTPIGILVGNRAFNQDIEQTRYKKLKTKLLTVLDKYENIFYVSGHDHNAQYYVHGKNHFFVSGNGSKLNRFKIKKYQNVYQNDQNTGFLKLTFEKEGNWHWGFE